MEEYDKAREWAIKEQQLMPVIEKVFAQCDANGNQVIDENEWATFVYQVAQQASSQGILVPTMNEQIVRRYYYAFNQVYTQHPGVSIAKLIRAIEGYDKVEEAYKA